MAKKYDTIDFRVQPAGTIKIPWVDCDRIIILINGRDVRNIVAEKERDIFTESGRDIQHAGDYNYLWASALYKYLVNVGLTNTKKWAPILCCTCDEVGCSCVKVEVEYTKDSVIWKDFDCYCDGSHLLH
ncbi:MAG: hypothetical protein J6X42_02645, partial [Alphaproteobacteria bacterium]|nr:hypothetical protein [Alphaproteobacteria bacterium]